MLDITMDIRKKEANAVLKSVLDDVRVRSDERSAIVQETVERLVKRELVPAMKKKSTLFNVMFKEISHIGSSYDGVRVNDAKEYDLNVVLNHSLPRDVVGIDHDKTQPGYVKMTVLKDLLTSVHQQQAISPYLQDYVRSFIVSEKDSQYFSPNKVRSWMESLIQKTIENRNDITFRKAGPAMTLHINLPDHGQVDVDLVPAFDFNVGTLEKLSPVYSNIKDSDDVFYAIPKPQKANCTRSDRELEWRLSFPIQERQLITGEKLTKPLIKLLKIFRDRQINLSGISSYSLKTVVMHMRKRDRIAQRNEMWNLDMYLPDLFLEALESLNVQLDAGIIPHIFHHQCNLLPNSWTKNKSTLQNKSAWLRRTVNILRRSLEPEINEQDCKSSWRSAFPRPQEHSNYR